MLPEASCDDGYRPIRTYSGVSTNVPESPRHSDDEETLERTRTVKSDELKQFCSMRDGPSLTPDGRVLDIDGGVAIFFSLDAARNESSERTLQLKRVRRKNLLAKLHNASFEMKTIAIDSCGIAHGCPRACITLGVERSQILRKFRLKKLARRCTDLILNRSTICLGADGKIHSYLEPCAVDAAGALHGTLPASMSLETDRCNVIRRFRSKQIARQSLGSPSRGTTICVGPDGKVNDTVDVSSIDSAGILRGGLPVCGSVGFDRSQTLRKFWLKKMSRQSKGSAMDGETICIGPDHKVRCLLDLGLSTSSRIRVEGKILNAKHARTIRSQFPVFVADVAGTIYW